MKTPLILFSNTSEGPIDYTFTHTVTIELHQHFEISTNFLECLLISYVRNENILLSGLHFDFQNMATRTGTQCRTGNSQKAVMDDITST